MHIEDTREKGKKGQGRGGSMRKKWAGVDVIGQEVDMIKIRIIHGDYEQRKFIECRWTVIK